MDCYSSVSPYLTRPMPTVAQQQYTPILTSTFHSTSKISILSSFFHKCNRLSNVEENSNTFINDLPSRPGTPEITLQPPTNIFSSFAGDWLSLFGNIDRRTANIHLSWFNNSLPLLSTGQSSGSSPFSSPTPPHLLQHSSSISLSTSTSTMLVSTLPLSCSSSDGTKQNR